MNIVYGFVSFAYLSLSTINKLSDCAQVDNEFHQMMNCSGELEFDF